jgi:hypothetical protein
MRERYCSEDGRLPIIPLIGALDEMRIERPKWPSISEDELVEIECAIERRVDLLLRYLLPDSLWISTLARLAWTLGLKRKAIERIMAMIRTDLEQNRLLFV